MTVDDLRSKPRVLWVHNTPRRGRMFLWDILDIIPDGVEVTSLELPVRPKIGSIRSLIGLVRKSARTVDMVHAQFGSLVGLASACAKKPFILTLRGTDFYVLPSTSWRGRIEARIRQLLSYLACTRANLIIVMSERMREDLRRWPFLKNKRVVVMTDPLGGEFLGEAQKAASKVFAEGPPLKILVGSISGENPVKRTWLMQRAVKICCEAGIPVNLNIVAGLPRSDVKDAILLSDVIALTSTHEGWPNIVKEGIALGLPFISTDVSDLRSLCQSGNMNRIVEADELDIALAIVDLLASLRIESALAPMMGDVVAKKHSLVYTYLRTYRS